jgi:hypothetical protein
MGRKRNKGKARKAKRIALVDTQQADVPVNPLLSLSLPRPPTPPRSFWPQSFFEKKSKRPLRHCRHGAESCTTAALIFRSSLEVIVSRKLATRMALPQALFHSFRVASSTCVGDLDDPNFREMVKSFYVASGVDSVVSKYRRELAKYIREETGSDRLIMCFVLSRAKTTGILGGWTNGAAVLLVRCGRCDLPRGIRGARFQVALRPPKNETRRCDWRRRTGYNTLLRETCTLFMLGRKEKAFEKSSEDEYLRSVQ